VKLDSTLTLLPPKGRHEGFGLVGMMNWIYNWYDPRKDVDVGLI
jgi:hypothetical protein